MKFAFGSIMKKQREPLAYKNAALSGVFRLK